VEPFAKALVPAFAPAPFLGLLVVTLLILYSRALYWAPTNIAFLLESAGLADVAIGLGLTIVGLGIHELGHAAAALRGGRGTQELGFTLAYRVVPAFYLQLEPAPASASRWNRLITEVGGSGLQLMYAALLVLWSIVAPALGVLVGAVLTVVLALWQLVPLPGQDGAHALRALRR
jgi:putative peptide zinc metalloprotease protein